MPAQHSAKRLALLATGLYVLWGLLHIGLGVGMAIAGFQNGGPDAELRAESTMFFVSAAIFGLMAIAIALVLNRRNDRAGFWLNLGMVGAVDVAFVLVLVLPGHVDLIGGLFGPVIYLGAAVCSALARSRAG